MLEKNMDIEREVNIMKKIREKNRATRAKEAI